MTAAISIPDLIAGGLMGFGVAMVLTGLTAWRRLFDTVACRCQPLSCEDSDDERPGGGTIAGAWAGHDGPACVGGLDAFGPGSAGQGDHHHHDEGDRR